MLFGLFKSSATRRRERWIAFNAEMIRNWLRRIWAFESLMNEDPDFGQLQDRLFSESFAGYLSGFADVLVSEFAEDESVRVRYSRLFFDRVMTKRGGEWVQSNIAGFLGTRSADFAAGFDAGRADARDCAANGQPSLTGLVKLFDCTEGLAA